MAQYSLVCPLECLNISCISPTFIIFILEGLVRRVEYAGNMANLNIEQKLISEPRGLYVEHRSESSLAEQERGVNQLRRKLKLAVKE